MSYSVIKQSKITSIFALLSVLAAFAPSAYSQSAAENIRPVSSVCMAGQPCVGTKSGGAMASNSSPMAAVAAAPPLAGFVGKFLVFAALAEGIAASAEGSILLALLVVGGLNTVLGLFYYLRVVKVMTFDPPPADRPQPSVGLVSLSGAAITAFVVPIVIFGVFWSGLYTLAHLTGGIVS